MPIIGYDPAPNGIGYHFQRDDGPPTYLYGPEADNLKAQIDASKTPDQRLAANGPGTFASPAALRPPDIGYDPANPMGGLPTFAPPAPAQPPAVQTAAPPQQGPTAGGLAQPPPQEESTVKYRYVPGSAAVDPTKMAASGVPVEVSETVSGALPENPQERAQRLEREKARGAEREVAESELKAVAAERVAVAEDARTQALHHLTDSYNDKVAEEKRLMTVQDAGNRKLAELQREDQAVANLQVDPNRLFRGEKGAVTAIGSALAVALGTFGSGISRTPNYALQMVQGAIDRDVASQVDAIHRKGAQTRNAVVDFAHTYGLDLQEAKLMVEAKQQRYAASLAGMQASKIGTLDAKQQAANLAETLLNQAQAREAAAIELYKGRAQKHFAIVQPRAGSRGGLVPVSMETTTKSGTSDPAMMNAQRQNQSFNLERRVTLPDGTFSWATTKERADKAQGQVNDSLEYKKNVARQREILSHKGNSLDPELRSEYNTLAARNKFLVKGTEDLGAITAADNTMANPITGEAGGDFLRLKESVLAASKSAEQHVDFRLRSAKKQLFKEPEAQNLIEPTEEGLGIREAH
jgi:hypothetical protein